MGNNPSAWGLSSLSGICLMFKNCLNLMETIISDQAEGLPGRHSKIQRPPRHQKKATWSAKSSKKEVKEQEINGVFVFKLNMPHTLGWSVSINVVHFLFHLLNKEKRSHQLYHINPDDLVLYTVSVIRSLHRLIMCEEPWHQLLRLHWVL